MKEKNLNEVKFSNISVKQDELEIKVSKGSNIVEGYLASFDNIDSDEDMFIKGAFSKSLQEHGVESNSNRKIAHLAYHDVTRPIGKFIELREDDNGLYFKSELGSHQDGKDFLAMYKSGIIREHSVGFNYLRDKMFQKVDDVSGKQYTLLTEVKLWEGSAVVFGANSETPNLTDIKSQKDLDNYLEGINERMESFIKAVQDGELSSKYNDLFTIELQQLKSSYNSLIRKESFEENTLIEDKSKEEEVITNRRRFL